ncbi:MULTISPECIES: transglycosylase domain-containing protein [Actinomycetaceae]|uniref:transglycosylase domain-containing protein n=1 Tax=Actinomycetaceae TaxID=2049 RepID=UPI0003974C91|nr:MULTISPECIES: transglycosylase domain-containing protein [Actinomycetaceae]ERH24475.1 transglycosylase [Actinomyces sp. oral taxon 172 str. F0311]WLD77912.1 transglycosylase domain-containing protein [Schaalia sp. HMT-172]
MSHSHSRAVRPTQLFALLLAFLSVSSLMGVVGAGMLVPIAGPTALVAKSVPSVFNELPGDLQTVAPAEESQLLDSSGGVIAHFYDKQRIVVPSANIADVMKKAIIAIEDKRFYEHNGVDATGIARALVTNLGDSGRQGASTITQQYVRNSLAERGYLEGDADQVSAATEQTTERKLREIKYAMALEKTQSKDEILTGYLNIAPFGPITYGVEAASQRYFSKSASELDYLEAALLAGLVQSPVQYDPLTHPEAAQERRDTVLATMLDQGVITQEEYDKGIATSVDSMLHPTVSSEGCSGAESSKAYFCDYVLAQFLEDPTFGATRVERERLLKTQGITIRTTMDPAMQDAAYSSLTNTIPVGGASGLNDALVSLDPRSGRVLSMAQNTTYGIEAGETMSNYSADGNFQVGSTFKVFTLLQWFKEGHSAYETVGSANTFYPNGAFKCDGRPITTEGYQVNDLAGKTGTMNVVRATGQSVNQAFVNMASRVDFCSIFDTAYDMGITEDGEVPSPYPANILGSVSASPLQMASVFAAIANSGQQCTPQSIESVTDRDENVLKEFSADCKEVISPDVANKTAALLTASAGQYYTSTRLGDGRPFAAKSGTTDGHANTWLTGFTPSVVTSAWVGHGENSSQEVGAVTINGHYYGEIYGETFVGQNIWAPYMTQILAGTPVEAVSNANIGASTPRTSTPTPSPTSSGH